MYNVNGTKEHELYEESGFEQYEYDVYGNNGIINQIREKIQSFDPQELRKNSYKMYYKPYSHWSQECQAKEGYTTVDAAWQGDCIGSISNQLLVIFILSCILYGI